MHIQLCTYIQMCFYIYIYIYIYHVHIYMYIYIHIYLLMFPKFWFKSEVRCICFLHTLGGGSLP